jgi:hypothetical protein
MPPAYAVTRRRIHHDRAFAKKTTFAELSLLSNCCGAAQSPVNSLRSGVDSTSLVDAGKFSGSGSDVEHGRALAKAQLIREKIYRIAWVVGSTSLLGVRPRIESLRRGVNFHRNRSVVASSMRTAWLLIEEALAGVVIIVAARAETSLGD